MLWDMATVESQEKLNKQAEEPVPEIVKETPVIKEIPPTVKVETI